MFEKLMEHYDRLVFFDTETTGLDAKKCQIIELAMVVVTKDGEQEAYDKFVKIPVGSHIPQEVVDITGITDEMVEDGISEAKAALEFFHYSHGEDLKTLLIAHNCQFDLGFTRELLRKQFGQELGDESILSADWLDSLTIVKDRKPYPHRLENAIDYYGLSDKVTNSHRAIDDVRALVAVCASMEKERDDLDKYINLFGFNPRYGISGEELSKITYKPQYYAPRGTDPFKTLPLYAKKGGNK